MNHHQPNPLPRRARWLCASGAVLATGTLAAALLGAWQQASSPQWLAATPEVLAEVAQCDQLGARAERERCKQSIVTARLHPAEVPVQVAQVPR